MTSGVKLKKKTTFDLTTRDPDQNVMDLFTCCLLFIVNIHELVFYSSVKFCQGSKSGTKGRYCYSFLHYIFWNGNYCEKQSNFLEKSIKNVSYKIHPYDVIPSTIKMTSTHCSVITYYKIIMLVSKCHYDYLTPPSTGSNFKNYRVPESMHSEVHFFKVQ